jgi:hypothetical protein
MDRRVALITPWLAVSGVSVAVCVLAVARFVISGVLVVVVVDCDGGCAVVITGDMVGSGGVIWVEELTVSTVVGVWVLESVVVLVIGSVWTHSSIPARFLSDCSCSAALPRSNPSVNPFSYPSFKIKAFPFTRALLSISFTNSYASSRPRAMIAS